MQSKYWTVKDDGALWKCSDCQVRYPANKVWATETPNGKKSIICKDCIDDDWITNAIHSGSV